MQYKFSSWNSLLLQSMFLAIRAQANSGLMMVDLGESASGMKKVVPGGEEEG